MSTFNRWCCHEHDSVGWNSKDGDHCWFCGKLYEAIYPPLVVLPKMAIPQRLNPAVDLSNISQSTPAETPDTLAP